MSREFHPPGTWPVIRAVGKVTFLEIMREKILYNCALVAVLLLLLGVLTSRLTALRADRVLQDFGLSALNISCTLIAILVGSAMLGREFERRTISVALSHPISRAQFIAGKFFGLLGVLGLNWVLLCGVFLTILWVDSPPEAKVPSIWQQPTLMLALIFVMLQSAVVASIAVLLSTFSTTSLSIMLSIGIYLIGNNISQVRLLATKMGSTLVSQALEIAAAVFPNFEHFNLGLKATYGLPVSWQFVVAGVAYAVVVTAAALVIGGVLIRSREI
jgi:Cu-processing system permease protein